MTLSRFINVFHDEKYCKNRLKRVREKNGIICKKCRYDRHYWLSAKWQWQCSACGFRTTLTSGTIMEGTKLPLRIWYIGMVCITYSRKVITVTELQKHLGHSRYDTIWTMMCKIRSVQDLDNDYDLFGLIQYDKNQLEIYIDKAS